MKTAISISDELFEKVDKTAKRLCISRSSLFSKAVSEFLEKYNNQRITEELNSIYGNASSNIDEKLLNLQLISLGKEDW